jgi:hypothetical protein
VADIERDGEIERLHHGVDQGKIVVQRLDAQLTGMAPVQDELAQGSSGAFAPGVEISRGLRIPLAVAEIDVQHVVLGLEQCRGVDGAPHGVHARRAPHGALARQARAERGVQ